MAGKPKPKKARKDERLLLRLTDAQKETLRKAAEKNGLTLSGFVLTSALRAASS